MCSIYNLSNSPRVLSILLEMRQFHEYKICLHLKNHSMREKSHVTSYLLDNTKGLPISLGI